MRNNDPIFWPSDSVDLQLRQQMNKNYSDCINILQTQWYQGDLDQRFRLGDQDLWGLIFPGVATYRRKIFNFNLINPAIQMISGYQRRNRKSTTCIPIMSPMQKTADQMTKCLYHVHNKCGAYQIYSDAFELGALTQGLGFITIFKDTTMDPISGDIRLRYIDMKSCLFDPYFRRHDLSDCRYWWTRQFFDKQEAATLYSNFTDEIMALPSGTYRDDKFYYMPEVYQIQFPNLIALDEYWYLATREATFIIDKETEECQEFEGDDKVLKDALQQLYAKSPEMKGRMKVIKRPRPTVRRSIVLNDRVMVDEPDPNKIDRYPVVPVLGYFDPDTPYYAYKFKGVVRDARDAQYLFNRRKVADLDILEAQQQGLKIKKGALVTPDDSFNQGNGRVLAIDPMFQMSDVEQMQIVPPAPTMIQMEDMLKNITMEILGASEVMMGFEVDDKSGLMTALKQGAGLIRLQKLFDQLDESQRLVGDIIIQMIQKNWTFGKVQQVIGEDPTPEFDNKLFFKYGCKIVQGMLTETQQQLELNQLLYFKQVTGIDVPSDEILEIAQLQNKDRIVKKIMEREQAAAQQQQQMAQLQMRQLEVENQTKIAYAQSQMGLAKERIAKIDTDKAVAIDKLRKSEQEDTHSLLNLMKAAKELQSMDIAHLRESIEALSHFKNLMQDPTEQAIDEVTDNAPSSAEASVS
jgi:hypothetical protein